VPFVGLEWSFMSRDLGLTETGVKNEEDEEENIPLGNRGRVADQDEEGEEEK